MVSPYPTRMVHLCRTLASSRLLLTIGCASACGNVYVLSQFGERLRAMEQLAADISSEMTDTRAVLGAVETQEKRWDTFHAKRSF